MKKGKQEDTTISKKEEERLIEKTKKISVREGSAYSMMEGFGSRYTTPFALAIGANNTQIGLLSSIPSLLGSFSQLYTLHEMDKWSRKKIVIIGVFLQALMWLALIGVGALYFVLDLRNSIPAYSLIFVYTLLVVFGAIASPAWTSWMRDIVTKNHGDYFGRRNRIVGIFAFASILVASFVLDYFKNTKLYLGFIILFSLAFLGRAISAYMFTKQYEPKLKPDKSAYFTIFQFVKKMASNNFGKFTIYSSLVLLVVTIAGPFFAVYMLKNLGFSYIDYMAVTLASLVSSFIFMPAWGKFSDKHGNVKTMRISGLMITLIPILWLLVGVFMVGKIENVTIVLILVEIYSGISWAGFNLASGNFLYDVVSRQRVAICASYYNILNGVGILIGATLGGILSSLSFTIFGLNSILFIFLLSGIGRLIIYAIFNKKLKEVRKIEDFSFKRYTKEKMFYLERVFKIFDTSKIRGRV
ncbi:MAG: MFS transporter [Nanoarchaeota archaeon]